MIISPTTKEQWNTLSHVLLEISGVQPTMDLKMLAWVDDGKIRMVVGFNAFVGKICQMHIAIVPGYKYTPKEMIYAVFHYVFIQANRDLVLATVNSKNEAAIKYDQRIGFKEMWRLPKMHDDGGDIVVLGMHRSECRHLRAIYTPGAQGHA